MTQAPLHITPLLDTHADNGFLARVPDKYIAMASRSLPDAATTPEDQIRIEIDAGWAGRVQLTFRKHRYRRPKAKTPIVFWCCHNAEALAPTGEPAPASN